MSLKSRVEKVEQKSGLQGGDPVDSIIICSLPPRLGEDGSVIPRKPGDTEGQKPGFAHNIKGPSAGQQVKAIEGETVAEFKARVRRIVESTE